MSKRVQSISRRSVSSREERKGQALSNPKEDLSKDEKDKKNDAVVVGEVDDSQPAFEIDAEDDILASESKFKHIWVISNKPLTKNIQKHLSGWDNIMSYDVELFTNRDTESLFKEHGVQHIWTDISDKYALQWVSKNIRKKGVYSIVFAPSAISCQKQSKYIDDVRNTEMVDLEIKYRDLKQLKSLTVAGLMENLELHTEIHSPPTLLQTLTRDSRVLKKKPLK